jgi:hypothetical protein
VLEKALNLGRVRVLGLGLGSEAGLEAGLESGVAQAQA